MREKVEAVLNQIRGRLQADGGDVELVDVTSDGLVSIRLSGACTECAKSPMTVWAFIESKLKEKVPEIKGVVCVEE